MNIEKSKLLELLEQSVALIKAQQAQSNELGYERIVSLRDFIEDKYNNNQRQCAINNKISPSHLGEMIRHDDSGNDKFIVVGDKLYRLARGEFK